MTQTVIAVFNSAAEAQNAVQQLMSRGFSSDSVDVSYQDNGTSHVANYDNENESGISKFFKSLFGNEDEATTYTRAAQRGSLVTVYAGSKEEAERAADILDEYGAIDVDKNNNQYGWDKEANRDKDIDVANTNQDTSIPIVEEDLQVGKRVVETGGVRVRSRIIEKPVEETLHLRKEYVSVERNKVNRPASEADFQEGTIEITEHAEVPIVTKEAKVVEEVTIGKNMEVENETVRDTVRKTEVDVEELEGKSKRKNK